MLLNLPELETGEELDQLSTLLATEEQSGSRLQTLKKSRSNLAKRLIAMVLFRLEISGVKKVETGTHKISVVGKGGKQSIEIDYDEVHDLDLIPEEFIETKVVKKVNKEAIANYLKANNSLSWARLVERGNRLSIK